VAAVGVTRPLQRASLLKSMYHFGNLQIKMLIRFTTTSTICELFNGVLSFQR